jgi:hypothetical protein
VIDSSNDNVVEPLDKTSVEPGDPSYDAGTVNITTRNLLEYCTKNSTTTFNLTLHVPTGQNEDPIADRTISVYVTAVDLNLESTFSDQQTYSISNNLIIPYTFEGLSDTSTTFTVTLDGTAIEPTISGGNITIRSQ